MTTSIPDSWELPTYLAGDLVPMDKYRNRVRQVVPPDADEDGDWEHDAEIRTHPSWAIRRGPVIPAQSEPLAPSPAADMKPYDPSDHPDRDFYNQDDLDHLEQHGFYQAEPGVWHRPVTSAEGKPMAGTHIITYDPGHRKPSTGERAPWVLTTDPDTVGVAFSSLRGNRGAMAAANADRDAIRRMSKVGSFLYRIAVEQSPARRNVDDWLAQHTDESFEHVPEASNEAWMRAHEDDPEHGYTHWEPSGNDYTYGDFGDAAGQSFHGGEGRSHVLPGSAYDWEDQPRHQQDQGYWNDPAWSGDDQEPEPGSRLFGQHSDEDEDDEIPEHEQDLADLGFNWRNRGDENTTPVGEHLRGEYVREQHDPEGNHIATHTMYEDPNGYSDSRWHLEHSPADTPGFVQSHTAHRFPADAINQYHQNAEQALLPQRGYEPHRGRSGVVSHWTRVDTDPQSGAEYHHEITAQPYAGEGSVHQGWLGQTHASHFPRGYGGYGNEGTHNQNVQPDLADVVREHDRIGRGLHPGGSQDYRTTRDELLADPSVARLGEPNWVDDSFYGDGKVGRAHWSMPHPNPPSQTVFDPTAPGHARQVPSEHPINAEATYNWDKGGYDFAYTHDGQRIWPNSEHFPAGAPVHVPGRQTQLPLER